MFACLTYHYNKRYPSDVTFAQIFLFDNHMKHPENGMVSAWNDFQTNETLDWRYTAGTFLRVV